MADLETIGPIEVFRAGTHQPMAGNPIAFSSQNVKAMADCDLTTDLVPIVIGHPQTDAPAFGWVDRLKVVDGKLLAWAKGVLPEFAEAVRNGHYRKISCSFFSPDHSANPTPGVWRLKHVGFLGAAAPAIPGLKPVRLSSPEPITSFAFHFDGTSHGKRVGWTRERCEFTTGPNDALTLEEAEKFPKALAPKGFVTEFDMFNPPPVEMSAADVQQNASYALQSELYELRRDKVERRLEGLLAQGRVLPVFAEEIMDFCASDVGSQTVSFADGDTKSATEWLFSYLERQPKGVSFGAFDIPDDPGVEVSEFTAPDGYEVDPAQNELYARARTIERTKGISFTDAVKIAAGQ